WLVLAVYLIESRFLPLQGSRRAMALLGVAAVLLAWLFPGELHRTVTSRWAPLHWLLGIASYGLFGAAVLHATLLNRADRQMRLKLRSPSPPPLGLPLLRLERLTFRFVEAGFLSLTAAIVLGWWFASPWRWDHKAIFSVLGWLVFAGLLAGRRAFGWRGPNATRWLYVGAVLLLLAYVGSRFVLEVLLQRPLT
ncbi:MAG: cytochrome c biogenesis protein CcsA, partial [Ideonella sp.]